MGAGGSKQVQVFNADSPVRLSQSVLETLQNSPENDSTRAQNTELKIQQRVNSELTRIRDAGASNLEKLTASLTTNPEKSEAEPERDLNSLFSHLSSPFYQDHNKKQDKDDSGRSHESVSKEIENLRSKLDSRKKREKTTPEVEKARESLVTCLRVNDRRPLDCWEEVEAFKAEVGRLEKRFVQNAGR